MMTWNELFHCSLIENIVVTVPYVEYRPRAALEEAVKLQTQLVRRLNRNRTRAVNMVTVPRREALELSRIRGEIYTVIIALTSTYRQPYQPGALDKARTLERRMNSLSCRLSYLGQRLGDGLETNHQRIKDRMYRRAAGFRRTLRELENMTTLARYEFRLVQNHVDPPLYSDYESDNNQPEHHM